MSKPEKISDVMARWYCGPNEHTWGPWRKVRAGTFEEGDKVRDAWVRECTECARLELVDERPDGD